MSTFEVKGNPNYAAEVVEVKNLIELPGLDNLVGLPVSGYTALVPRSTQVGDVLVVFPAEAQLSEAFAAANNLFRHSERNSNPEVKGYLEDNRRVRAVKFRGHPSNALALSLESLFPLVDGPDPTPGTTFDTIDGVTISQKYELPVTAGPTGKSQQEKVWRRVDDKFLPEHIDSENYWRNSHKIAPNAIVTVSQKLHGTSIRIGHTLVKRQLTWRDKVARLFGVPVKDTEFDVVYGSRKVIKDPNNPRQDHFYGYDLWTDVGQSVADLIPQNVIVYGEVIGWTKDGRPIQANYTYNVPKGEAHLYIYRVAVVSNDGRLYDLSWEAMEQFAAERGLKVVPLLWRGPHKEFETDPWLDTHHWPVYPNAVPLSDPKSVDEGVVVRAEGILPIALKAKSPIFLGHETALLDKGTEVLS